MAENSKSSSDSFIDKIVTDPKQVPETLMLSGYLGASSEEGHRRIYFDVQLNSYIEIPEDGILHIMDISSAQSPLCGSYVCIKKSAVIIQGKAGTERKRSKFLEGEIVNEHLAAGFPEEGGIDNTVAFCPPTFAGFPCGFTSNPLSCEILENPTSNSFCPTQRSCPTIANGCPTSRPVHCPTVGSGGICPTRHPNYICPTSYCDIYQGIDPLMQQGPQNFAQPMGEAAGQQHDLQAGQQLKSHTMLSQLCHTYQPALCVPNTVTVLNCPTRYPKLCNSTVNQICITRNFCVTQSRSTCPPTRICATNPPICYSPQTINCPIETLACPSQFNCPTIGNCPSMSGCPTLANCPTFGACPSIACGFEGGFGQPFNYGY
jgi:hypothetical protein